MPEQEVFLSLGSNIHPRKSIVDAVQQLKKSFTVKQISPVYETAPHGPAGDQPFFNLIVSIETLLSGAELQTKLREIESALGRIRNPTNKFAPRTMDIDIIPQPCFQSQPFIMIPLADIAPGHKDSETGKTFLELSQEFTEEKKSYRKIDLNL